MMALHHSFEENDCLLCQTTLKTAHPLFQDVWPKLKAEFKNVHVSCAYRGPEAQEFAFQQGRSRLRWNASDHNKEDSTGKPCSRAIDLFFINVDGQAVFPPWQYLRAAEWFEKNNHPVGAGVKWKKFSDGPHFYLLPSVAQP